MVYYRPVTLDDYAQVKALLEVVGWNERTKEESRLRRMIDNADRTVGAFNDEHLLVGFARALCDEAFNGYVSTLCVHPAYRGQGIGRELAAQITEDSPEITWVLRSTDEAVGFWVRVGFQPAENPMQRKRTR